jgi:hypothetical protein
MSEHLASYFNSFNRTDIQTHDSHDFLGIGRLTETDTVFSILIMTNDSGKKIDINSCLMKLKGNF